MNLLSMLDHPLGMDSMMSRYQNISVDKTEHYIIFIFCHKQLHFYKYACIGTGGVGGLLWIALGRLEWSPLVC